MSIKEERHPEARYLMPIVIWTRDAEGDSAEGKVWILPSQGTAILEMYGEEFPFCGANAIQPVIDELGWGSLPLLADVSEAVRKFRHGLIFYVEGPSDVKQELAKLKERLEALLPS